MLKRAFLSVAALGALGMGANNAVAQCSCDGAVGHAMPTSVESYNVGSLPVVVSEPSVGQGQTYQRFSYSPVETSASAIAAAPVPMAMAPMVTSPMVQPRYPTVYGSMPQAQSYRRFSYQPSVQGRSSGSTHKQPWQYPKTDPRRYRTN